MPIPTTFATDMKPQSPRLLALSIEPLESRIAPATITLGSASGASNYNDTSLFTNVQDGIEPGGLINNDAISKILGGTDGSDDANVYYLRLEPGMVIGLSVGGQAPTNYITGQTDGIKGFGIAVFVDDGDGIVEPSELTGLALGKNSDIQVSGTVFGDVVANYNEATGSLGGALEASGTATDLLTNSVKFFGAAAVSGKIIAGGNIQNVNITGRVESILTGSGGNSVAYDLNGSVADGGDTLLVTPAAGKRGPNISNVTIGDVDRIEAGAGGARAAGGSISKITLIADTSGWVLKAGDGGAGVGKKGGLGGSVTNVFANGLNATQVDTSPNSVIQVFAGHGGDGVGSAPGGKGGAVTDLRIGYEVTPDGRITASVNQVADSVLIEAGNGGSGKVAGAGGSLSGIRVISAPTLSVNNIVLHGGAGGDNTVTGGKAGAGGNVTSFDLRNPGTSPGSQQSIIVVDAGDGGNALSGSAGANGGSTQDGFFVTYSVFATGGDGTDGTKGGSGGNVKMIRAFDGFDGVRARNIAIDAGRGGLGFAGKGGNGGVIDGITVSNPEISVFDVNQSPGAGDGGDSSKGPGGKGGGIFNLKVNDVDTVPHVMATMKLTAGDGGDTGKGNGGAGGVIGGNNVVSGLNLSLLATGGKGGNAGGTKGNGGSGGTISNFSFDSRDTTDALLSPVDASLTSGTGGNGVGKGKGGAGGGLSTLSLLIDGDVTVNGGTGGNGGATGAVGAGGSISVAAATSDRGLVSIIAGSAGATGLKAAAGGSLTQINAQAETTIELRGGNGSQGGAGGTIKEIGVSDVTQASGPNSGITIVAGNGSAGTKTAGAGGSVIGVDGFIAATGNTLIQAGNGGGLATKGAAGGSVNGISFRGGGGTGAIVTIQAGDAGDSISAKKGAAGGNVTDVGIGILVFDPENPSAFSVDPDTVIRNLVAGDGGDASKTGGVGGTVSEVRVRHDIGDMAGEEFGYDTMGGIFAGVGGTGVVPGAAGSVLSISADAIASIMAGKVKNGDIIQLKNLATKVDGLVLNSTERSAVDPTGAFTNYDTAAIIGAIRNPGAAGANIFEDGEFDDIVDDNKFGIGDATNSSTDGFVAAINFGTNTDNPTSIRPEAVLTVNASKQSDFIDYTNNL